MTTDDTESGDATTDAEAAATESQVPPEEGAADDPLSDFKAVGTLVLKWVGDYSGPIAVFTSVAVGTSFALVTVYYARLMQRLGTSPAAVGFDDQALIARALVGVVFLVLLFILAFYWIWLWCKEWTGSEWRLRLAEFGLCEAILVLVAVFCTAKHSELDGATAGLAALFPLLSLSRIVRLLYRKVQHFFDRHRSESASARRAPNIWVVWLTVAVALIAYLYANVEISADQDAVTIRRQFGTESMLSIIAPFQPTLETVRHVDPVVAQSEDITVGDRVLLLADHDGNKVVLLRHRLGAATFSRTVPVPSASIQLDVSPPG
jgi:hypothetical protein